MSHDEIIPSDTTNGHKSTVVKCLKRLFKYWTHQLGENIEWVPEIQFTESATNPRDFFTLDERRRLREAALDLGSVSSYHSLTTDERAEWIAYSQDGEGFILPKDVGDEPE